MPKHWNCFVAGCRSNYSTRIEGLKYFRIPKILQKDYDAFFKTDSVNWETAVICSLHWSQERENFNHMPNVRVPKVWQDKVSGSDVKKERILPYKRSSKRVRTAKSTLKDEFKQKLDDLKKDNSHFKIEVESLKKELEELTEQNASLRAANEISNFEKQQLMEKLSELTREKQNVEEMLRSMREQRREFHWESISMDRFKYLCGLQKEEFVTVFDCFKPFLYLLTYEGCKESQDCHRKLTKENELLACLIVCRHALHLGVIAWILNISEVTMGRIFEAWMTFGHAVFSKLDLSHPKCLIKEMMPKAYKNLGYSHTVLVLDATEIKTTGFSDLLMNELFFSDYKNCHTVKALVCLTPYGTSAKIPDVYPGSITDTAITDMTGALDNVLCHDGVLTDKGWTIY